MATINDGGRAFPTTNGASGMSLRDWFAGQAMIGMQQALVPYSMNYAENAERAYAMADAMLAARSLKQEEN